jgi:hypothetical protein
MRHCFWTLALAFATFGMQSLPEASAENTTGGQFWSLRPPVRPDVPRVRSAERVRNPIDAFIVAALEKNALSLSPEAERLTLIRRATFDLTGLPPAPQDITAFMADPAPDAYERLVDRLLASPHYGERWGRHWLDLAGYADSEGILDADAVRTSAWRYRDYVIDAINKDKPYDRFLKEQLAGDELVDYWKAYENSQELSPEVLEAVIATGYLRCASDASQPGFAKLKNAPGYYYQTLDDTVKIVASSIMALTMECARCHAHKYDPIPQADYYRLQAIFMSTYRPDQWVPQAERRLFEVTKHGLRLAAAQSDARIDEWRKKADALQEEFAGYLYTGRLGKLPQTIRDDVRRALATDPAKRNEIQKYLADKFEKELRPDRQTLDRLLPEQFLTYKSRLKEIEDAVKAEKAKRGIGAEIRAAYDVPGEAKTYVLHRGEYGEPGPEVQPGVPAAIATAKPFQWTRPVKGAHSSGRRLALAEWLTRPDHPLTARVLVNRLWLQHFGEGIVATVDNFGQKGARPTQPELLDWLATEFVRRGWSFKAMHRLIMTSSTYRQTSQFDPTLHGSARQVDPDNRLLWRQRLHRLEAEALRDTILTAAGKLNRRMFGPPVSVQRQPEGEVTEAVDRTGQRRSVYLQVRRSQPLTLLQAFDQPVMETNCTRRASSTVPSQALTLSNGDFVIQQAQAMATRVLEEAPDDPCGYAFQVALGRSPTAKERDAASVFLQSQSSRQANTAGQGARDTQRAEASRRAMADLCQMLMSCNEFIFVD